MVTLECVVKQGECHCEELRATKLRNQLLSVAIAILVLGLGILVVRSRDAEAR